MITALFTKLFHLVYPLDTSGMTTIERAKKGLNLIFGRWAVIFLKIKILMIKCRYAKFS